MKLAFIKDPHLRFGFARPQGRTDEFESQIMAKLDFIKDYCLDNSVSNIIYTGDVLDRKAPSDYGHHQSVANEYTLAGIERYIPQYTPFGNHDLPYSSIQMKEKSILHYYMEHGVISPLPLFEDNVRVYGIDFKESLDENIKDMEALHKVMDENNYNIVVIHQHFAPQNAQNNELSHSSYKRYSSLYHLGKINAFVFGHLHIGFKTETINNPTSGRTQHYINPWSMTRLARSYYSVNSEHIPEMVILDTETNEIKHVTLPHEPYENSFIEVEMKMNTEFNDCLQLFMDNLSKTADESGELIPNSNIAETVQYYLDKAEGVS